MTTRPQEHDAEGWARDYLSRWARVSDDNLASIAAEVWHARGVADRHVDCRSHGCGAPDTADWWTRYADELCRISRLPADVDPLTYRPAVVVGMVTP